MTMMNISGASPTIHTLAISSEHAPMSLEDLPSCNVTSKYKHEHGHG